MLKELNIKNVAVIDKVNIEFEKGFNVLTGETGAGKSILIDSLNMALGQRTSKELVRNGAEYAAVDAVFEIENAETLKNIFDETDIDLEEESGCVILSRKITADGKNSCRINGRAATLTMVKEVGKYLIDIHGQSDNQDILNPNKHIAFVDEYGRLQSHLEKYTNAYDEYIKLKKEYEQLTFDDKNKAQRLDLIKFQIEEISSAKLKIGEEEELESEKAYLSNAENILSGISESYSNLYGGEDSSRSSAYDLMTNSAKELGNISEYDDKILDFLNRINSAVADVEELSRDLRKYLEGIDFDGERLNYTEDRLSVVYNLKRKYGNSVSDILEYLSQISDEAEKIEGADERLNELKAEIEISEKKLKNLADILTGERKKAAEKLEKSIKSELFDLDMPKVEFKVMIDATTDFTKNGCDKLEFLISTNPGESLKPLVKIASGGEMSRIMLAVKSILADSDKVETLIFDEIDTGVSGRAAQKIAEKMDKLSVDKQILAITHLPQIAAMADDNYLIQKNVSEDITSTSVIHLTSDERKSEIARIMGGVSVTELTLSAAQEMLDMADSVKNKNRDREDD